jgi:hypothetical protein
MTCRCLQLKHQNEKKKNQLLRKKERDMSIRTKGRTRHFLKSKTKHGKRMKKHLKKHQCMVILLTRESETPRQEIFP